MTRKLLTWTKNTSLFKLIKGVIIFLNGSWRLVITLITTENFVKIISRSFWAVFNFLVVLVKFCCQFSALGDSNPWSSMKSQRRLVSYRPTDNSTGLFNCHWKKMNINWKTLKNTFRKVSDRFELICFFQKMVFNRLKENFCWPALFFLNRLTTIHFFLQFQMLAHLGPHFFLF